MGNGERQKQWERVALLDPSGKEMFTFPKIAGQDLIAVLRALILYLDCGVKTAQLEDLPATVISQANLKTIRNTVAAALYEIEHSGGDMDLAAMPVGGNA